MKLEDIKILDEAMYKTYIDMAKERVNFLKLKATKHKVEEKINLLYGQASEWNYIKNFLIMMFRRQFSREFLNYMFNTYDPRIDHKKAHRDIMMFIKTNRTNWIIRKSEIR